MKHSTAGFVVVLVIGLVAGAWGARWWAERHPIAETQASQVIAAPPKSDKTRVEAIAVERVALPRGVSAVGSLRSEDSVMLRSEVTGRIAQINFQEGGRVAKGQTLIQLDDSVTRAELQQAQANLSLASSQYNRARQLAEQGFISKQARDEAASQFKVQQAAVALAKAHLEKTAILAPFDGLIGLRNVSVGDYVSPGSDLVPIESIDPLQVDFRIPEQFFSEIKVGQRLVLSFDALPGQTREGQVGAISPLVDVGGRSILLRADVPNPDGVLRPGMFARVRLEFTDDFALVVPETALAPSGDEQYVYRVEDGKVERVTVRIGLRQSGRVEILEGLKKGDMVVTSGLQKVTDGQEVEVASPASGTVS